MNNKTPMTIQYPIGYSNSNNPTPIFELSKEQENIIRQIELLNYDIQLGKEAQLLLNNIQRNCKHPIIIDIHGEPYDNRFCKICDKYLGAI